MKPEKKSTNQIMEGKIAVIRIAGKTKIRKDIAETLQRLNLKGKYDCIVLDQPDSQKAGMIKKVKDFVAFGQISDELFKKLADSRKSEQKNMGQTFSLHPPRKGIDTKKHSGVGKGVLGNNKDRMDQLIERML